jgi:catechol 2,3-dioxygenase-like lactoylglutathione lyase family enzyme
VLVEFTRLNHITINVPEGEHEKVRWFYGSVLGLKEVSFPKALDSVYDLIWYQLMDFLIHIDFSPPFFKTAESRHPGLEVKNIVKLRENLQAKGADTRDAVPIPDRHRFYLVDPFGNYFELIEMLQKKE